MEIIAFQKKVYVSIFYFPTENTIIMVTIVYGMFEFSL